MIEIKCESFDFDEHIQSEWYDYFIEMEDIDPDLWNSMSREERFDYVMPICQEFMDTYGYRMSDVDWEDFIYDLEDNNFHTEVRAFMTLR